MKWKGLRSVLLEQELSRTRSVSIIQQGLSWQLGSAHEKCVKG